MVYHAMQDQLRANGCGGIAAWRVLLFDQPRDKLFANKAVGVCFTTGIIIKAEDHRTH
jgi:hypothetical protein